MIVIVLYSQRTREPVAPTRLAGVPEVSTEPNTTTQTSTTIPTSAIENEIPTYRAISPEAVLSLICGVLSLFSFAHWLFLSFAAVAIVLGVLADRKIVRLADVLTGRGIAQAGITLGLVFGLASITTATVQDWILVREAQKFARTYHDVLEKGTLEQALWYGQAPPVRSGKTPEEIADELRKSMRMGGMLEMENATLAKLRSRVHDDKADVHFSKIEVRGKEGLNVFAGALYELHPSAGKPIPDSERFALVLIKGMVQNRRYDWWVERIVYPYTPASYKPVDKPADDGHGHSHG
jgi:hypothetical protein